MENEMQLLLWLSGLAQIVLVFGSLFIPRALRWQAELEKVSLLIKQMFWVYAAYILFINLSFGLLSLLLYQELLNGSLFSIIISGFIAVYWISRIIIQFVYFDRKSLPQGKLNKLAEILLVILFLFLSLTYSLTFCINLNLYL